MLGETILNAFKDASNNRAGLIQRRQDVEVARREVVVALDCGGNAWG